MQNFRRLTTIGLSIVVTGAMLGGTAMAQTADATAAQNGGYRASATSEALRISLFGQEITASRATALVDSSPKAKGTATQALVGPVFSGEAVAEQSSVGTVSKDTEPCTGAELEAIPGLERVDVTCASAVATLVANGGSARGLGSEVALEPSASALLAALQLQEPVQGAVGQIYEQAINPLVQALTGNPVGDLVKAGTDTVQDVLDDVLGLQSTVRVVVAPALAEASVTADTVSAHARAQGVRIELLPVDGAGATNGLLPDDLLPGEPLITITVGNAEVSKSVGRNGGTPKTDAKASLVTVEFGTNALSSALGLDTQTITINPNQSICLLEGTPLETCIVVAAAGVDADGNPFADGTSIEALKGVNGGIGVVTGRAGVSASPDAARGLPVGGPAVAAPADALPRTGGPALLPFLGASLLGLAAAGRRLTRKR
jgi:hypothetical protein